MVVVITKEQAEKVKEIIPGEWYWADIHASLEEEPECPGGILVLAFVPEEGGVQK